MLPIEVAILRIWLHFSEFLQDYTTLKWRGVLLFAFAFAEWHCVAAVCVLHFFLTFSNDQKTVELRFTIIFRVVDWFCGHVQSSAKAEFTIWKFQNYCNLSILQHTTVFCICSNARVFAFQKMISNYTVDTLGTVTFRVVCWFGGHARLWSKGWTNKQQLLNQN